MDPEEKEHVEDTPEITPEETPSAVATDQSTELPAETPAPTHKYADRLSQAYPDRKFEKPEDYDAALDEHLSELSDYRDKGQIANSKLISLFDAEPQVGDIVRDMINGSTFREALARYVSPQDLTAIEGDPDYEGWNKNKTAREEALGKRKSAEEEFNTNLQMSQQQIADFATENKLSDDQAELLLSSLDNIVAEVKAGKVTKETLLLMKKAVDYDNAVGSAAETGAIAGRNANIVAKKETEPIGDGLPKVGNSNEPPMINKPAPGYMDNLINTTKKRQYL
jgi:hypothetical protein